MGKDKAAADAAALATAAAARTSHYGAPLVSAKAPAINALPASNQRKQPAANSSNFYQPPREDAGSFANVGRQAPPHRLSAPPATGSHPHPSRVHSQRIRRQSGPSHRHLSQVSELYVVPTTPPTNLKTLSKSTLALFLFAVVSFYKVVASGEEAIVTVFHWSDSGIEFSSKILGGNHDTTRWE